PAALPRGAQFVRAVRATADPAGLNIEVESSWGALSLPVRLVGEFNVDNVLTVLAVLLAWSIPPEEAARALAGSRAASGRMEMFGGGGKSPLAIVDYAHTPDALANALRAARRHCRATLRLVFGCGGDRDAGKRPLMGKIAAELADEIIVTDDNPRTEDPRRIVADIVAGTGRRAPLVIEHDRALAIHLALARSGPGDVVLIAGKGHEDYQIVGSERRPFRDQSVVVAELAGRPARGLPRAADRGRRQQRQDHHEGNDRLDPRSGGQLSRHARQSQQPHRRAADAAAPRAHAPLCGGGDGHQSPGRGRGPGRHRA